MLYLAESLPHCHESDVLVGLLKTDTLSEVALLPEYTEYTNTSNIAERISQYLKVNNTLFCLKFNTDGSQRSKHYFEAKLKQGYGGAMVSPPKTVSSDIPFFHTTQTQCLPVVR